MKRYFISGILTYLIFYFSFRFLSGLASLVLIYFDIEKLAYIGLLILSAILTLFLLMKLYYFMEKRKQNRTSVILVGFLIVVFLLCSGVNRYVGYLAENNKTINFEKVEYLAYPDFAIGLATIVGVLLLWFKKEKGVASSNTSLD